MLERFRQFLFPREAEKDEGFVQEILRLSHLGLRITAYAELAVPPLMILAQVTLISDPIATPTYLAMGLCMMAVGVVTLLISRTDWSYERARILSLMSVAVIGVIMIVGSVTVAIQVPGSGHYLAGRITGLMMLVIAVIPLLPSHTLSLGAFFGACYAAVLWAASRDYRWIQSELNVYDHVFMAMVTVIATALTTVVYRQRSENYASYMTALRASMDLRRTQSQMLISESAASLGRLAAALSHEFNTPLGVMKSNVSTLTGLSDRIPSASGEQQVRLRDMQSELHRSLGTAIDRLAEIVGRMQRYTNLDRAEVAATDIIALLRDVIHLHEPIFEGRARVELNLEPLPRVLCRPQLLSAVFSNLISNAVEACNGNGNVVISTRRREGEAEIRIQDNGRGLAPHELTMIFDPGFKVDHGKVATGNWGLFGSRQIIHEHGGDIRITSAQGQGTVVSVILPLSGELLS